MSRDLETPAECFVDRRNRQQADAAPVHDRRQFGDSREGLSAEAHELAAAVDAYKLRHRRRFITHEEMLDVIKSLGYHK